MHNRNLTDKESLLISTALDNASSHAELIQIQADLQALNLRLQNDPPADMHEITERLTKLAKEHLEKRTALSTLASLVRAGYLRIEAPIHIQELT